MFNRVELDSAPRVRAHQAADCWAHLQRDRAAGLARDQLDRILQLSCPLWTCRRSDDVTSFGWTPARGKAGEPSDRETTISSLVSFETQLNPHPRPSPELIDLHLLELPRVHEAGCTRVVWGDRGIPRIASITILVVAVALGEGRFHGAAAPSSCVNLPVVCRGSRGKTIWPRACRSPPSGVSGESRSGNTRGPTEKLNSFRPPPPRCVCRPPPGQHQKFAGATTAPCLVTSLRPLELCLFN